jgi:hypothetical protein
MAEKIKQNPTAFTLENDVKMIVTTEKGFCGFLSQADSKIEIDINVMGKQRYYQTTFTDLVSILENADEELSQSRKFLSYKS